MGLPHKFEQYNKATTEQLKSNFSDILRNIGEDVHREGIVKTPERAAKAIQFSYFWALSRPSRNS